jgi:hypothetical protein
VTRSLKKLLQLSAVSLLVGLTTMTLAGNENARFLANRCRCCVKVAQYRSEACPPVHTPVQISPLLSNRSKLDYPHPGISQGFTSVFC